MNQSTTDTVKRWLPTSEPLIGGALASVVILILNRLGIIADPHLTSEAITTAVSFLAASIIHKPTPAQTQEFEREEETTMGTLVGQVVKQRVDENPKAIEHLLGAVAPLFLPSQPPPAPPPEPLEPEPLPVISSEARAEATGVVR